MSLFVPVNEPDDIRRELLTNNKAVLGALRRYEHYREIRKAKLEAFNELAHTWAELEKLQRKLKSALPKTDLKAQPVQKFTPATIAQRPVAKPEQPKAPIQKPKPHEHKSKVQLLEEQLAKIEGKLQRLQ
jgi:polyhydroxyalkanoate synthesis regulator phasin